MARVDIRDYTIEYFEPIYARILLKSGVSRTKTSYASLPTYKEILQLTEAYSFNLVELNDSEEIGTFASCEKMTVAPTIPNDYKWVEQVNMCETFLDCKALTHAPILPNNLHNMWGIFYNCTNLIGEIYVPSSVPSSSNYTQSAFRGTTKPTLLKGTKGSVLAALAETSDRGNVTYQLQPPLSSIQCKVHPNDEIYPWDATSWCYGDAKVKVNDVWETPRSIWIKHNNTWTEI